MIGQVRENVELLTYRPMCVQILNKCGTPQILIIDCTYYIQHMAVAEMIRIRIIHLISKVNPPEVINNVSYGKPRNELETNEVLYTM